MKKLIAIVLTLTMALSMVACGEPEATTPDSTAADNTATDTATTDIATGDFTDEQLAVAEKFAAMTEKFQAITDTINADENLLAIPDLIDSMNTLIDAVNADDALFADASNLTPEVLQNLEDDIVIGNEIIVELEAMIKNYQGKKAITVSVEIINETGADIHGLAMSPANSEEWGGDMLEAPLANGESGVTEMTFTEDTLVWDLLASDAEGTTLTFMGIDFAQAPMEGAQLILSATEGGAFMADFA